MLHIATVHYQTDKWINIQLSYLEKYIKQPYKIYAFLCGDAINHKEKFFYASTELITDHATKLNILADIIYFSSGSEDEPILFLDGDAFPIAPLDGFISSALKSHPLTAIQRPENICDRQPHPSFCLTTVGFWKTINGDWKEGYQWISSKNEKRTDAGANLLKILEDNKIEWCKLLRTSQNPWHPVFFGIYGDIIYHHGAGFRDPLTMNDRLNPLEDLYKSKPYIWVLNKVLKRVSIVNKFRIHRLLGIKNKLIKRNKTVSDLLYRLIREDGGKFISFIKEGNNTF